jgi:excisionase family DNA binding protein
MEKLLSTPEVAALLNVKEWTIRHWVSEKKIPYIKLGRCVRFNQETIAKHIEKNKVE